jgi:hypothetical protein
VIEAFLDGLPAGTVAAVGIGGSLAPTLELVCRSIILIDLLKKLIDQSNPCLFLYRIFLLFNPDINVLESRIVCCCCRCCYCCDYEET